MKVSLKDAQVNIMLEIEGSVYLVGFERDDLGAVSTLIKSAADSVYPTGKTQSELLEFFGVTN